MNSHDRDDISELKLRIGNVEKQLEKIIMNDLPHLFKIACTNKGALMVVIPLTLLILGLVIGLYFRVG